MIAHSLENLPSGDHLADDSDNVSKHFLIRPKFTSELLHVVLENVSILQDMEEIKRPICHN